MTAKTDAERQAELRDRRRAGLISITLNIHHRSIAEALIAEDLLDEDDFDNKQAIARALEGARIIIKKK